MTDSESPKDLPITLASEPDFRLGSLAVRPALREVEGPGGKAVIEPRVMAVLVALASARGSVLSRDSLIARCWAGRLVGDDAISRCIAAIRRLASDQGGGDFRVETIARVGYRLVTAQGPATGAPPPSPVPVPAQRPIAGARWPIVVPLVAAVALLGAVWVLAGPDARPEPAWHVGAGVPLLDSPRIERHVAFHPSEDLFVYSEGARVGERQLFVRRSGDFRALPVSDLAGDHSAPAWSSSGTRLAWVQNLPGQSCRILVMEFPGGSPVPVGRCAHETFSALAWSATGDAIFYLDRVASDGPARVFKQPLSGGRAVPVTSPPSGPPGDVALAMSGHRLAIGRQSGQGDGEYFLLEGEAGNRQTLVKGPGWHGGIAWLPGGESILVQREQAQGSHLFVVPLDGTAVQPLLPLPDRSTRFAVGPEGQLGVETTRVRSTVRKLPVQAALPVTVEISSGMSRLPAVSSTGALALVSARTGQWKLWLGSFAASRPVLALGDERVHRLAWSPGGERLVIALRRPAGDALWVVDRVGRMIKEIELQAAQLGSVGWGRDDHTLLVTRLEAGQWHASWVELATGRLTPLPGVGWVSAHASADGVLASRSGVDGLWRIGNQPERISAFPPADRGIHWRMVGDRLVFPGPGPEPAHLEEWDVRVGKRIRRTPGESDLLEASWNLHPGDGSVYWITGAVDTDVMLYQLKRAAR